jgi:hypothetical protein
MSSRKASSDPAAAARDVLRRLGGGRHVISSANGTWVDRAEWAAIRRESAGAVVSAPYGIVPETFSCGPLIGIAGTLLTRRMIPLAGGGLADATHVTPATGGEAVDSVVALCTDYAGAVSGIRVGLADV